MATPRVLDLESLLRPIPGDAPTGENLREDSSPTSLYYQIKDARNAARTMERAAQQAEDPGSAPSADWQPVLELAPMLLTERSKDLEIVAWLIEGQARENGFAGLRDGFELVRGLTESFWDGLFPMPDEEGLLTRVAPLTGLNGDEAEGTLIVPIGMIPLVYSDTDALGAWHFRTAREVSAIVDPEARQRRIDAGAITVERFQSAANSTDPNYLFDQLDDVEACLERFEALSRALDQRCGSASPPTSNIRAALEDVLDCLRFLTKDLTRPSAAGEASSAADSASGGGAPAAAAASVPGEVRTRQDALEALRRTRDWFRKTEPHSPISYMLDQSMRWAQTPLHLLVNELIPDPSALAAFQVRTGMSASPQPGEPS
jgi:type VI secretion system protein ImpA